MCACINTEKTHRIPLAVLSFSPETVELCFNSFMMPLTNQHTRGIVCCRYHCCYRRLPLLFARAIRKHPSFDSENSKLFHLFTCSFYPKTRSLASNLCTQSTLQPNRQQNIYTFNLCTWFWFKLRAHDAHPVHIDSMTRTFYFQDMTEGGKSNKLNETLKRAHALFLSSENDCLSWRWLFRV